ncbi:MAG: PDZ domain-containing protein [Planctomycetaceae bacterium]|nr:PDZ domain-containing protein [Planctomycetaceae bacterium]
MFFRTVRNCLKLGIPVLIVIGYVRSGFAQSELDAALALESALVKIIEDSEPSVVSIARIRTNDADQDPAVRLNPFGRFNWRNQDRQARRDPESPDFQPNSFGAGVILSRQDAPNSRYILTNYHVVKGGPVSGANAAEAEAELFVRIKGGHGYYASIRAADPRSDLAVLDIDYQRMKLGPRDLKPLKIAKDLKIRKGQIVIGLGNPYSIARDGSASASWGIISNQARHPKLPPEPETITSHSEETLHHTGTLLQVDMKLNLGTSGGALINLKGEFVGLTTSLAAIEGFEASSGFAIPADASFVRIFETLARGEEVEYGFLGVGPQDVSAREITRQGFPFAQASAPILRSVFGNSPAGRAGLQEGDLVLKIQGKTILNRRDLMREISLLEPDSEAKVRIWRRNLNQPVDITVKLGKWPVVNDEELIVTHPRYPEWRGLAVDYPTGRNRFMTRSFRYPDAVLVREVTPGSPVDQAGLQSGEFIASVQDRPVKTPQEFHEALNNLDGDITLRLIDGQQITVPAPSPDPTSTP